MTFDYIKLLPHTLVPKKLLTFLFSILAKSESPQIKNFLIKKFILKYQVNMKEAQEEDPTKYNSFNDFFIRQLKNNCRSIAKAAIVSPVDGIISEFGLISHGQLLQAKHRYYSVDDLLVNKLSSQFQQSSFATFYLSPRDYHRVHMPINGTLQEICYVPGKLFSVNPRIAELRPALFARNERVIAFFNTSLGLMAMILVGATIVGAIGTRWHGDIPRFGRQRLLNIPLNNTLGVGEEFGYFKLGSTVILLFAEGEKVKWLSNLQNGHHICYGQALV